MQQGGNETSVSFLSIKEEANVVIQDTVQGIVGKQEVTYDPKLVQQWIEDINTACLDKLQNLSQNFKFIVSTTVVQKVGAGIHVSSTCFWEQATDGNLTFRWENATMYVIIQVFGLAL